MRVWEYAKQIKTDTKELLNQLNKLGFNIKSHMEFITDEMLEALGLKTKKKLSILMATTECVPFVKTGGLADVIGALPKELNNLGADVRVVLPKYGIIKEQYKNEMKPVTVTTVQVGWRNSYCGIEVLEHEGVTYYFIDNEYYFKRESLYGHFDDGERFAFFDRAVLELIDQIDFLPDVIHINDWHLGMTPLMLELDYRHKEKFKNIKTVMTIHNLQYQGWFDLSVQTDLCNISEEHFHNGTTRQDGSVNFLKTGLVTADYITTVSPNYAKEIQDFYFGEGLDSILRMRQGVVQGILNGLDVKRNDPKTDPLIPFNFDLDTIEQKYANKTELQKRFGFKEDRNKPLIGMVTRLAEQKGLDLINYAFDDLMALDAQYILLGSGDEEFEVFFKKMSEQYPDQFKAYIGFDADLAQLIYAGSDFFLMPSLFEPCGLSQMISMRYGTIPIVREVGGLKDTVVPYNEYKKRGDGFGFNSYDADDMVHVVEYALEIYQQKEHMDVLIKNGMTKDFSWTNSAKQYIDLYKKLK